MNKKSVGMWVAMVGAFGLMALLPHAALAAAPWETPMQSVVNYLTGSTGILLATLGVIGVGVTAAFGQISWAHAGQVGLAIGIVFGAAQIVAILHP